MARRKWVANLDMYRKVPVDLLEGSREGKILSWAAILLIITLFYKETQSFMSPSLATDLSLDRDKEERIKVNFNITMLDLKCEYATIDVFSALGHEQNVTKSVNRWSVDADGVLQEYVHRNMLQHDIEMHDTRVTTTLEELHEHGEDAVSLDAKTLEFAKNEFKFVFVDFYAGWCSHCRDLAPTWETLAKVMTDAGEHAVNNHPIYGEGTKYSYSDEEYKKAVELAKPVFVAKIDCVDHQDVCFNNRIAGYPTLRLYINGERYAGGDYYGNRNVMGLTEFLAVAEERYKEENEEENGGEEESGSMDIPREMLKLRLNITEEERTWAEAIERTRHSIHQHWNAKEHPGCRIAGQLQMNRAPGNFYIQARSKSHDLAPHMTNVSHIVHHLSFGDAKLINYVSKREKSIDFPGKFMDSIQPMEEHVYVTQNLHEAYHHYLKLIPTKLNNQLTPSDRAWNTLSYAKAYQVLQSSELAFYRSDVVPEAKFVVDLSPIAVSYRIKGRQWYEYITSLMAIIGGTFTVLGFLDSGVLTVKKAVIKKRRQTVPNPYDTKK